MASSTQTSGFNKHGSSHNNEITGENLEFGNGFTSVDFLPQVLTPCGLYKSATYENFRTLICRANEFLRKNPKWKIVNCESVEFKTKDDCVDPNKMSYKAHGDKATSYVRGLRLWLAEKQEESERHQQIDFFNQVPQQLEGNFETLDTVLERFNSKVQLDPLPGRIINVQSQKMKVSDFQKFDPDNSNWSEYSNSGKTLLFVLRIFYDLTDNSSEKIGVKDFIPDKIAKERICSNPKYEKFSDIVNKASVWCAEQSDVRICNIQTLEIRKKKGNEVNTQKMKYTENKLFPTHFVRILRVIYTKPFTSCHPGNEKLTPIRELTCRTFEPVIEPTGFLSDDYENLVLTKKRISAWIKATGADVLSVETLAFRITSGGEWTEGIEASYTFNTDESEYWKFVIRLYLDGKYQEPPPEMLPPPPASEKDCCDVS